MQARGVHLQYSFEPTDQTGATLHNPLFDLLSALQSHGSIQHAAKALGASYRHVWGSLRRWEETLGEPLVTWSQGQPARLTPFADRMLWAERRARTRLVPHIEALRAELQRVLAEALDGSQHVLTVWASHDLGLPLLRDLASDQGLHIELRFAGSVDALRALAAGRCLVAGFHVPPLGIDARGDVLTPLALDASGARRHPTAGASLFAQALKPLLKPGLHKLIGCLRRTQGLMLRPRLRPAVRGLADLVPGHAPRGDQPPLRFVNRQPGSGTRLLMDQLLLEHGLLPRQIPGYLDAPEDSHLAVAAAIASGHGDAGPGVEAAARQFGLDFLPLLDEDYLLVCLKDALEHPAVQRLRQTLESPAWAQALATLPGYAPAQSGEVLSLTQALRWWHFRPPKATPEEADAGTADDALRHAAGEHGDAMDG
ncbi:substrate-binding domain-containing protein [Pseudaquabacterium rugosum]|uniref:Substrate-binding domain-containing protein n=1 Tax=Pseudaquabacterium rugosum TaxID=2984194 RepID=A0ABU9BK36_9BURK